MSKMIQVRNVPDAIHGVLKSRAALAGMTLSDYLLKMMAESVAIPSRDEMWARLRSRERVHLDVSVAEILREERESRS